MANSPLSTSYYPCPRTMKVKDFRACASGIVKICSFDSVDSFYIGSVKDIPFIYLDCWVASLTAAFLYFKSSESVCFVIRLES